MPGILADQHSPDLGAEVETQPPCTDAAKDLNHSSSTRTTSEGEGAACKENPNGSTVQEELATGSLDQHEAQLETEEKTPDKEPPIKQKRHIKDPFASELTTLNVRIVLPGVQQPIDAVVTSRDTVHDLLQFSLERPEGCYRTCLSVRFKKKRMDDFFELGAIEGMQDGSTVELVEEPYTQKDIRIHVQRLRDLLSISANPLTHALSNTSGLSLSFLAAITLKDPTEGGQESADPAQLEPPAWSLPQDHPHPPPLTPFYPPSFEAHFKVSECLRSLSYSSWNPPPGHRRMKGDLLYIDVTTLEGQDYYITACPMGFYLNRSTDKDHFDPAPRKITNHSRHLVGLLSQISLLFKKNFAQLQKFGEKKHAFELFPAPYPVSTWITPKPEHKPVNFRIDDGVCLKGAPDELLLGQLRDWNEELQLARELPADTDQQRVFRDRTLFKIHTEFVQSAAKGAVDVVNGYIPSVNPGDDEKHRMYMWNNIFYSLAFDGRDYYEDFGGDDGAHAAAGGDLNGVASFEQLDVKGLCTLGTVVVDYQGVRVVCQTIIPGLLQREQDSSVVYGSIDGGKNILANEKFKELLKKPASDLHIREHKLLTGKDEEVELPSSLELKGIIGTDGRYYALDLFRLFPPDRLYVVEKQHRHKLAVFRPELLDAFLQYRYMLFLRLAQKKASELNVLQKLQMFIHPMLRATKEDKKDEVSEDGEESKILADALAAEEAKVSSEGKPPGENHGNDQGAEEDTGSKPPGDGQMSGQGPAEQSSSKPPGENQANVPTSETESSSQPAGDSQANGHVSVEQSSSKPPGENQANVPTSETESSSQPAGESQANGHVSEEQSSSKPPGENQANVRTPETESSSQPAGDSQANGHVSEEQSSTGENQANVRTSETESSSQPAGESQANGHVSEEQSSSKPPGENQANVPTSETESSSQPAGESQANGYVSEEQSSSKSPGENQANANVPTSETESSSQPAGLSQANGQSCTGESQANRPVPEEQSSSKPPADNQVNGQGPEEVKPPGEPSCQGPEEVKPPGEPSCQGSEEESGSKSPSESRTNGRTSGAEAGEGHANGRLPEVDCSSKSPGESHANSQGSEVASNSSASVSEKTGTVKSESHSKEPSSSANQSEGLNGPAKMPHSQTETPSPGPEPQSKDPLTTPNRHNQESSTASQATSGAPAKESIADITHISSDLTNLETLSAFIRSSDSSNLLILSADESQHNQPVTLSEALAGLPGLVGEMVSKDLSMEDEEETADSVDMKTCLGPPDASDIESFSSNPTLWKVMQEAAKEAGYGETLEFDVRFNVDILLQGAQHADTEEVLEKDRALISEVSSFLIRHALPNFIRDCIQLSSIPLDGQSLSEAMQSRGINMRYLGLVAMLAKKRDDLLHVTRVAVREMVVRIARRRLRKLMREAPVQKLSEAIAHFLNCLLGEVDASSEELPLTNGQSRKKQKKKKTKAWNQPDSLYLKMTAKDLWDDIVEEIGWYYLYEFKEPSLSEACSKLGIHKLSLLRELCKKTGVQMVLREYDFSSKPTFTEDDIVNLYPIIKHTNFRPSCAVMLLEYANSRMSAGKFKVARQLYLEALRLFLQVYGPMHVDIADCYGKLADLSLVNGDAVDALSNQHKATLILERVLGVDNSQTVAAYIKLANCCRQTNQISAALRLMYRARYLILLLHGEDHPNLSSCDTRIAFLLCAIKDTSNAYRFFQSSLPLYQKYYGKESVQVAASHHHLAEVHCAFGDYRSALQHEKAAYSIHCKKFGVEHEHTKDSSAFLQELTEKAVTMQKTINEMTGKGKPTSTGAKVLLLGSWGDVTSMMNRRQKKTVKKRSKKQPNATDKASQD